MELTDYLWIPILCTLASFFKSWGIGANDCANSFATSVGAKVLTLRQAVLVAAIFEFTGAFLMGSNCYSYSYSTLRINKNERK